MEALSSVVPSESSRSLPQTTAEIATAKVERAWEQVRRKLLGDLGQSVYDTWIAPLSLDGFEGGTIVVSAPKLFVRDWVQNHFSMNITSAFEAFGVTMPSVAFRVRTHELRVGPSAPAQATVVSFIDQDASKSIWNRILHPAQTFDNFVGETNQFGMHAIRAFAEAGDSEVPLVFVHGGFGYGKTHLLNAAALELRKRGSRTLYLRAEDFMRHYLGALHRKDTLRFKEELRAADAIIIDDLQHICRSDATASEFLYTVNAFADLRRRVVISADRSPSELGGLGQDVKSRLMGGLVITLSKPDRASRLKILQARRAEFVKDRPGVVISDMVLERVADVDDATPREIIGIFTKLATYADLTKKPVTLENAEDMIGLRTSGSVRISIDDVQRKTADFYKLTVADFHSPQRARRVARPRQVAMYLARQLTSRSLPEIGRRFGGRDHTTVLHACRRVEFLCVEDPTFKQEVDFLTQSISKAT